MKKILVTGSSGFVGQFLQKTAAAEYQVLTLTRQRTQEILLSDSNIDQYQNIDTLIHLAGRAHVMHETAEDVYQAYAAVNIGYTLKVVELAKRLNIKRFIFLSSVKVNGEASIQPFTETDRPQPSDAYGQTKLEAEIKLREFCLANNMELVIIRPPLIYGPDVKANFKQLIKICISPLPLPFRCVHNKRSFISLHNLADFILLCSWHPNAANQTFMISDDEDVSLADLIKIIRSINKQQPLLFPMPLWMLQSIFKVLGKSEWTQRLLGSLQLDINKAKNLLGWHPKINVYDGILQTLEKQR